MKKLVMILTAALTISQAAHAGIGESYSQSNRHYGGVGRWNGDHANWSFRGYVITEGFDSLGRCDIIMISHLNCTDLTSYEVTELLRGILPPGYTWRAYSGNAYGAPTWAMSYGGVNWYAMYYTEVGTRNAYAYNTKCLRVGAEPTLIARGYMNAPAGRRVASDVSRPTSRPRSKVAAKSRPSAPSESTVSINEI
jgi:hypothetical protein